MSFTTHGGVESVIRVGIAAPEELVRAGIRSVLEMDDQLSVVVDGHTSRVLDLTDRVPLAVLVASPATECEALRLLRTVNRRPVPPRTVVLADRVSKRGARALLGERVAGIFRRSTARLHLPWAVRAAAQGGLALEPALASSLVDSYLEPLRRAQTQSEAQTLLSRLTVREREVLTLLADGHAAPAIAAMLSLAPGTVKSYMRSVYDKLGTGNRIQAARVLWAAGTVPSPAPVPSRAADSTAIRTSRSGDPHYNPTA